MRIGLVAPPFIAVPPLRYGGTELFVAHLAKELHGRGHAITVYANGDSALPCRVAWRYPHTDWPLDDVTRAQFKNADHTAWAIAAAAASVDVLHLNDVVGLPFTMLVDVPTVLTIHHPHEPAISEQYLRYPNVEYVAIARWLARAEPMPHVHVVHHGIPTSTYTFADRKEDYVVFLGRMAPCKGPHLAIEAARRARVRLKLAGEVQPVFQDYWDARVRPHIDGHWVEFVGEADHAQKCALLSKARALLFPIQWHEPFGLVMIEAMACGTPVLAFDGGAVEEIVHDGVNGWICSDATDMAERIASTSIEPDVCRDFVDRHFSVARMGADYLRVYETAINRAHAPRSRTAEV
jgi:glycosyltransferase involved in cell wall biosynthesis